MKSSLKVGIQGELSSHVGPGQTITLGGDPRATVFSTPSMINLMEYAARDLLRPYLESGEESVGVDVQITHTAATPPRNKVTAEAVVVAIDKNVISFEVVARDPWGEIGRGTHRRAVIETAKFADRLARQKGSGEVASFAELSGRFQHLECELDGKVLRLTINRPRKRNAMNALLTGELEQVVTWLAGTSVAINVVVVAGTGETFCAGDDVGDLPEATSDAAALSLRRGALFQQITELSQIFIAAIDGLCLGGGLVLAAACDFRIATHRAQMGLPEVRLGWPPNYGMGIVQSLVGRARTLELALTGEAIDGQRAQTIGLVNRVVAVTQLKPEVDNLARHLGRLPTQALSAAKQLLAPGSDWSDDVATRAFVQCLSFDTARQSRDRFK